jgi:hypothetical protein
MASHLPDYLIRTAARNEPVIAVTSSSFRFRLAGIPSQQRLSLAFVLAVNVKLFAQSHTHVQRPASLLEWHRCFAWYPGPIVIDKKMPTRGRNSSIEGGLPADTAAE